jgi:hypothetical protein
MLFHDMFSVRKNGAGGDRVLPQCACVPTANCRAKHDGRQTSRDNVMHIRPRAGGTRATWHEHSPDTRGDSCTVPRNGVGEDD